MLIIDKFFALLAQFTNLNRFLAPSLAVLFLYYSGTEKNSIILGFIFAVITLAPYVVVVTGVVFGMKYFNFIGWAWMDALVPASSLLLLPTLGLMAWLATHLRMDISLKDDQIACLPPEASESRKERLRS